MHPYSLDTNERRNVLLGLAIISVLATWGLHQFLLYLKATSPWWLDSPSILLFYGLFFTVFDKFCWRSPILKTVRLIKTANLTGKWSGFIQSSFNEHTVKTQATLEIFQSWTKIKISLSTDKSTSSSETASLITGSPEGISLTYQYINEPKANTADTMHIHRGTARLTFKEDVLIGEYYSGRDRKNFGMINLKRC